MKPEWHILKRVIWPEKASMFVIIGGAAGMAGDLTSFFSDMVSPGTLAALFGAAAVTSALLCLQRAALVDPANEQAVEEVISCRVCDALRFSLFASACFMLLLAVGQGQSATEAIAEKLGLIHQDVQTIREDVAQIADVTQAQSIIENPRQPADYYTNAWIYTNIRRDPTKAYEQLQTLYKEFSPGKMDAADLLFTTGRQIKGRTEVMQQLEQIAYNQKDATLLVVAGRHAETPEQAERFYELARQMDPAQPFAYWDMQRSHSPLVTKGTPAERAAAIKKEVESLEAFLKRYGEHPAAHYFFMPQYQGDFDQIARQVLSSSRQNLESYEKIIEMQAQQPKPRRAPRSN